MSKRSRIPPKSIMKPKYLKPFFSHKILLSDYEQWLWTVNNSDNLFLSNKLAQKLAYGYFFFLCGFKNLKIIFISSIQKLLTGTTRVYTQPTFSASFLNYFLSHTTCCRTTQLYYLVFHCTYLYCCLRSDYGLWESTLLNYHTELDKSVHFLLVTHCLTSGFPSIFIPFIFLCQCILFTLTPLCVGKARL